MNPYKPPTLEMKHYAIIDTKAKFRALCAKLMKVSSFAFDTETNTLKVNGPNEDFLCVGISISWGAANNYYIPLNHRRHIDSRRNLEESYVAQGLKKVFAREDVIINGWNLKFDLHVMTRIGVIDDIESVGRNNNLFDGMLAAWIIDENFPKSLKENSDRYFGYAQTHFADVIQNVPKEVKKEFGLKASNKATFDLVLIDDGAPYALDDAYRTWNLCVLFLDLLKDEGMEDIFYHHMIPFLGCLYRMEERGITVDIEHLESMRKDISKDIENLLYEMTEIVGVEFNPGSTQQLGEILFGYQKVKKESPLMELSFHFPPVSQTAKGAPSTDAGTLWNLSRKEFVRNKRKQEGVKFVKKLMDYKKLVKLKSAFIDGLSEQLYDDGKAHCSFNQVGADSGRLSCQNPNLQQLPNANEDDKYQIRSLFIGGANPQFDSDRNKIIACDFSNLEIRVNAHFSQDKRLLEMFANGEDVHGSTAVNMFELDCKPNECKKLYKPLRQAAKILNFLLIYGGSAPTLYENLKNDRNDPIDLGDETHLKQYAKYGVKDGIDVAQVYIDKYFDTYRGVAQFIKNQHRFASKYGFVWTVLKRKRRLPDINSYDKKMRSYCERLSVNAPIQGSAADITSSTQRRIDNDEWFVDHGCLMLLQVHDEVVFECPPQFVDEAIKKIKHYFKYPFGDDVEFVPTLDSEADSGWSYAEAK